MPVPSTRRREFWAGARALTPLVVGVIPFAVIFGALAVTNNISIAAAAAMSAIVFAGSSQFIAAGMIAAGASPLVIIAATFVVNLRHALYAVTLAPHVRHLPQRWLLPLGFMLTDEAFVVVIRRYTDPDRSPFKHWYYLGAAAMLYVNWQAFTAVGLWLGQTLTDPRTWGLDFALPLTFIGMLAPQLGHRSVLACVLTAGSAALLFHNLPHQSGLIVAALAGVAVGVIADRASSTRAPLAPVQRSP